VQAPAGEKAGPYTRATRGIASDANSSESTAVTATFIRVARSVTAASSVVLART